mmetsp:Transcript_125080/g.233974  ORF Transcript_125080/g.233974 Transcript_125080/m.233974 type:complete len:105 (+) Transcript_125080:81-395(+)
MTSSRRARFFMRMSMQTKTSFSTDLDVCWTLLSRPRMESAFVAASLDSRVSQAGLPAQEELPQAAQRCCLETQVPTEDFQEAKTIKLIITTASETGLILMHAAP